MKVIRVPLHLRDGESGGTITSILLFVSGSPRAASTLITAYQTLPTISQRLHKYFLISQRGRLNPGTNNSPNSRNTFCWNANMAKLRIYIYVSAVPWLWRSVPGLSPYNIGFEPSSNPVDLMVNNTSNVSTT